MAISSVLPPSPVSRLLRRCVLSAVTLAALGGGSSAFADTLRLAHASSSDSLINQAMQRFAQEVSDKTDGDLTIQIFPDGQLGDEGPIAESVGYGAIDIGLGGVVDNIDPRLNVVSLPFLFAGADNVHAFLDGKPGQELMQMGADNGYRMLGALDSGFRQFATTDKTIDTPADVEGLKFRTPPNAVILQTIKQLGAVAQSIPFGEVYSSLQSGVVNAVEPEIRDFSDQKWYEVAKKVAMVNYIWSANYWFMNRDRFDGLEDRDQKALLDAVADTTQWYRQQLESVSAQVASDMKSRGVAFNHPDAAPFQQAVQPVYDHFSDEWGADFVSHIQQAAKDERQ